MFLFEIQNLDHCNVTVVLIRCLGCLTIICDSISVEGSFGRFFLANESKISASDFQRLDPFIQQILEIFSWLLLANLVAINVLPTPTHWWYLVQIVFEIKTLLIERKIDYSKDTKYSTIKVTEISLDFLWKKIIILIWILKTNQTKKIEKIMNEKLPLTSNCFFSTSTTELNLISTFLTFLSKSVNYKSSNKFTIIRKFFF